MIKKRHSAVSKSNVLVLCGEFWLIICKGIGQHFGKLLPFLQSEMISCLYDKNEAIASGRLGWLPGYRLPGTSW